MNQDMILIIDDNKEFAGCLQERLNKENNCKNVVIILWDESKDVRSLSQIITETPEFTVEALLFININLTLFGTNKRQIQNGIELLTWLRVMEILNHCILYSFELMHSILMRYPRHLIVASKGTTYLQLPISVTKFDFLKCKNEKANIENLKRLFKITIDTIEIQHHLANIYGLWYMFNIHNKYFSSQKIEETIFSREFRNEFDALQQKIANFLFKHEVSQKTDDLKNHILTLKDKIKNKNPRILYIDDKAELGWNHLIKQMLFPDENHHSLKWYNPKNENFSTEENFNSTIDTIKNLIDNNGAFTDCILLDLRLADEEGDIDDLDTLSGIRVLKAIHGKYPSLPIIMTTASNKAKSVKKAIESGADSLWTKPGLQDIKDDAYFLRNYLELLTYVEAAVTRYSTNTEKHIVKAEFELAKLSKRFIPKIPYPLNKIDIILTDTNIWAETSSSLIKYHKFLFWLSQSTKSRFVLIDDVLTELFIHSQYTGPEPIDKSLKMSALFSLRKIQEYKDSGKVFNDNNAVEQAIKKKINYRIEPSYGEFVVISSVDQIRSRHKSNEDAEKEKQRRIFKNKRPLHADDTFNSLIPNYLSTNKNVLFISNDKGLKYSLILNLLNKQVSIHPIPKKEDLNMHIIKINVNKFFCFLVPGGEISKILFDKDNNYQITEL